VTDENEITPQTNYVMIFLDGSCFWEPRFDLSVTQCHIDVKWFPFDEQTCHLVFESWLLSESILKFKTNDSNVFLDELVEPEGWDLTGMCQHYEIVYYLSFW